MEHTTHVMNDAWGGDQKSKREFFERVHERIMCIVRGARRRYPGAANAESTEGDFNAIWVKMVEQQIQRQQAYTSSAHFYAAAYRSITNLLIDRLRSVRNIGTIAPTMEESVTHGVATGVGDTEEECIYRAAVESLDDDEFTLYDLIYLQGITQTEAFRRLGVAESTGRDRHNRLIQKLSRLVRSKARKPEARA